MARIGLTLRAKSGTGIMHQWTGVIARHSGDIQSVDILSIEAAESMIYLELEIQAEADALIADLRALDVILEEVENELDAVLPRGWPIEIELVWEPPWAPERMSERARRFMKW